MSVMLNSEIVLLQLVLFGNVKFLEVLHQSISTAVFSFKDLDHIVNSGFGHLVLVMVFSSV